MMWAGAFSPQRHGVLGVFFIWLSKILPRLLLICTLLSFFSAAYSYAATPAGTIIRSQAQAYFLDENNQRQQVESNEVETLIQEAPGINLEQSQTRLVAKNGSYVFPHLLTNTGNITATYSIRVPDGNKLYQDLNHSGQIDGQPLLTDDITLVPGAAFAFLVSGQATSSDMDLLVRADVRECKSSDRNKQKRCFDKNNDQIKISNSPVFSVAKSMDKSQATAGDEVTITLEYERQGKEQGNSRLVLKDPLPAAFEYIKNSSRWYDKNGAIQPIDEPTDTLTPEFNLRNIKGDTADGKVQFKVKIKKGYAGKTVYNKAVYQFSIGNGESNGNLSGEQYTNSVPLLIMGAGVTINGSRYSSSKDLGEPITVLSGVAGETVEFVNYIWNTGTQIASYQVTPEDRENTFPSGSTYCLSLNAQCTRFQTKPVLDVIDLKPGEYREVKLKVKLPSTFTPQKNGYFITLKATGPDRIEDSALNWLVQLSDEQFAVDLTIERPVSGDTVVPGQGAGPEADPVKTFNGVAGQTVIIEKLFVNNTGGMADSYNLEVVDSANGTLPKGVNWRFINDGSMPVNNTGVVKQSTYIRIKLAFDLPADINPATYSFYIKANSPVNNAKDHLHLALSVTSGESLTLEPDGQAQVMPGSFVTYAHRLTNNSHQAMDNINLQLSDSLKSQGWQSVVYNDQDGNGHLSKSDSPIDGHFSLPKQQTQHLIVKVFAPANASQGTQNITELVAVWGDNNQLMVTDTSTVNNTDVVITKKQAAWDCSSAIPTSFSTVSFPALPGSCVVYKLTATNQGVETVQNVVIHDAAPNFTVFFNKEGLPIAKQAIDKPSVSSRTITATWTKLDPGASVSLLFGIQIQ